MTLESQKHFAARIGKHPAYVTRLKARGVLVGAGGGVLGEKEKRLIDVELSLARMRELGIGMLRPDVAERHAAERHAANRGTAGAAPDRGQENPDQEHDDTTGDDDAGDDAGEDLEGMPVSEESGLARNKRVAMHFQNNLIKIGMALKLGSRFYLKDVRDEGREVGNALRATLDRMVDQLAPRLAVTKDADARRALIVEHLARERRQVNRAFPSALRRLRKSARGTP